MTMPRHRIVRSHPQLDLGDTFAPHPHFKRRHRRLGQTAAPKRWQKFKIMHMGDGSAGLQVRPQIADPLVPRHNRQRGVPR